MPWNLSETDLIQPRLLMQSSSERTRPGKRRRRRRRRKKSARGFPHHQIACNNEKKEEVLAMAMATTAANSPPQSSAEDIFSDTMELASYLHRRVQEIGKQFCHRPFRINTNEKGEFLPGFLQGPPCASELPLGPSSVDFKKACDPAQLGALCKNTENCLQRKERAPSPAEERRSSQLCSTSAFIPGLCEYTEMKKCMAVNPHDNFFDEGGIFNRKMEGFTSIHLHNRRPDQARTCNSVHFSPKKGEDVQLPMPDREEKIQFYSEMASGSALAKVKVAHVLPSTQRGEKFPLFSENAPQLPSKGSVMCDTSPRIAADVNFTNFHEVENHNISVDAANCPPMALQLPTLEDHVISDAENARELPCMQKGEKDRGNPENSASCVVVSPKPCHEGSLERGEGDAILQESAGKQVGIHISSTCSREVPENPLPLHSRVLLCVSSVDSSECDNCRSEAVKGHAVTDKVGSSNSNGASGNKSEEIDAVNEATWLDTHGKDEDDDDDETIVVAVGGDMSHSQETKSDALDLLLDAIQVTSGGVLAEKEEADACGPSVLHTKRHAHGRNGCKSLRDRGSSSAKMFQKNGSVHLDVNTSHDICDSTHEGNLIVNASHDIQDGAHKGILSGIVPFPVGRFPVVRKRSYRCSQTVVKKEPSGHSVPSVVRFKSLQAVSEVNYFNKGRPGKEPAANKQEQGAKVYLSKMHETQKTIQMVLNGKQEKDWEKKQESAEKEDQFCKQEKKARLGDAADLDEGRAKGQMLPMPASEGVQVKDEEEQGAGMSRRARSQILPYKFSDSVLQPWKKRDRRKS